MALVEKLIIRMVSHRHCCLLDYHSCLPEAETGPLLGRWPHFAVAVDYWPAAPFLRSLSYTYAAHCRIWGGFQHVEAIIIPDDLSHLTERSAFPDDGAAAPAADLASVLQVLKPAHEAAAAVAAPDFSGEYVAAGTAPIPCSLFVVLPEPLLCQVPDFPADDGFVMIPDDNAGNLAMVVFLLMGQIIRGVGFLLDQIPH